MISSAELNPHGYPTTDEIDTNLAVLLERINKIRSAWAKPMTVTSGLRSQAQQDQLIAQGKSSASHSKHLIGAAVDIYDPELQLTAWLKADPDLLELAQLWCEEGNTNWVHLQIFPPASGNRWFLP